MQEMQVQSLVQEDPLEKKMATQSSILPWKILWTSVKNLPVNAGDYQCKRCRFNPQFRKIPWRRKRQPNPVFLPRKFYGQRSLPGYTVHGVTKNWTLLSIHTHGAKHFPCDTPLIFNSEGYYHILIKGFYEDAQIHRVVKHTRSSRNLHAGWEGDKNNKFRCYWEKGYRDRDGSGGSRER